MKLSQIAKLINFQAQSELPDVLIKGVATLASASDSDITFFTNIKYIMDLKDTKAVACILEEKYLQYLPENVIGLLHPNPHYAYALILEQLYPAQKYNGFRSPSASISSSAVVPESCYIAENVVIQDGAVLGEGCVVLSNSVIGENVVIGAHSIIKESVTICNAKIGCKCVIHSGARIGQDGFGFAPFDKGIMKVMQIGAVRIGNDVEIGANTCIDRGALGDTIIGDGTKIDNLVQIAHGCVIGKYCFICGQVGLAGSTIVEDGVMLGGQAGCSGHITIGAGSKIAAKSGIMQDVQPGSVLGGAPAMPIKDWHKVTYKLKQLIKKG